MNDDILDTLVSAALKKERLRKEARKMNDNFAVGVDKDSKVTSIKPLGGEFNFMLKHIESLKYKATYDAALDLFAERNNFGIFEIGSYSKMLCECQPIAYIVGYIDFVGKEPEIEYDIDQGPIND